MNQYAFSQNATEKKPVSVSELAPIAPLIVRDLEVCDIVKEKNVVLEKANRELVIDNNRLTGENKELSGKVVTYKRRSGKRLRVAIVAVGVAVLETYLILKSI